YRGKIEPPPPMLIWSLFSGFTSFIGIMILGLITKYGAAIKDHNLPFAIAPAGASAVLIFAVPASPLAQPRNVIVGHIIAALIGTFMHALFLNVADSFRWMPAALSVGISIWLMGLTNCYHPPAGATAFIGGYFTPEIKAVGWWYPLYPVLPVCLIMVFTGVILNNFYRVYPVYWFTP
ncbi:HPP-domain-containing protein, partial [Coemansia reversa NRRL 1564]